MHGQNHIKFQHSLVSLTSSSSCLRLLPQPPVTSILPSIVPSKTCFTTQFLREMWPIQSTSFLFNGYRIFLSSMTPSTTSLYFHIISPISPAPHFKTSRVFLIYLPKCPNHAPNVSVYGVRVWSRGWNLCPHSLWVWSFGFTQTCVSGLLLAARGH